MGRFTDAQWKFSKNATAVPVILIPRHIKNLGRTDSQRDVDL
jgi:hypothetical protein